MQREMAAQIEQARPEYLVFVKVQTSWVSIPYSPHGKGGYVLGWIPKFTERFYQPVGLVNMTQPAAEYFWDSDSPAHHPAREFIAVFKRK